jgi:LCP family protein required for cell wall assembly
MHARMSDDPRNPAQPEDRPYRLYAGGRPGESASGERPYTTYKARPRGLKARLRGEEDAELSGSGDRDGERRPRREGERDGWAIARRVLKYVAIAVGAWLLLSLVLFLISAQVQSGSIPTSASNALASGPNMLTSTDNVLVIGTDQRPSGSKEPGANTNDAGSRSDTLMLWRIGGGVSRRLSIPRDTIVPIPGYGLNKINAAYAFGGPALTIKTVEAFTGVKINHLIIVNLANFPKFIDAIGGIDVTTGRICSNISGGVKNGGFTLNLRPGNHHLDGRDALTLARTRENACNAASNDLTREGYQQKILNGIKSSLLSPAAFFHLPWASWYAPEAVRSDMGGFTLLSLFVAAELGGSAPTHILGVNNLPLPDATSPAGQAIVRHDVNRLMSG